MPRGRPVGYRPNLTRKVIPEYKTCTRCGDIKYRTEFNPNDASADGLRSWCNECVSTYNRERRMEKLKGTKEN